MRMLLVDNLANHMRGLPESAANRLAHDLTCCVSAHLGNFPTPDGRTPELSVFPQEIWSVHTLGVPWEAYRAVFPQAGGAVEHHEVKPLCSAPAQLDGVLAPQATQSGLWGGSLLAALGRLLGSARHDMAIFAPYWRADGVQSLLSTASRNDYSGLRVRLFTQAAYRMGASDQEGVNHFVKKMQSMGAQVQTYAPMDDYNGIAPFLHAKLMVADAKRAYVGSANFTASGLEHGIEAGVLLTGEPAASFGRWSQAVETICRSWYCDE